MQEIENRDSEELVREYYKEYSKYVLETRALPSTMDGLKLVQRRILYTANQMPQKLTKTALMAGNVMHLHPHGESSGAIYTMSSPLNNVKLFNTKGNFGSICSSPAASRYTELYLNEIGRYIYCQFLDYTDYEEGELGIPEPTYLPSLLPYCYLEGSEGIGCGLSTSILPVNVMELIDYIRSYITTKCFDVDKPTPEFGSIIVDMDDDQRDEEVRKATSTINYKSVITRESDTIFVVEDLYGRSIDALVKKLGWCIDNGQVDFRDESSIRGRYVFEIMDKKLDPEYFYTYLEKYCTRKDTFNRWMVDSDKSAIHCDFDYVILRTLAGLNKAIDRMIDTKKSQAKSRLKLLIAINQLRKSGQLNKITDMTQNEFIAWLPLICMEADEDISREVFKKPISYLTRAHEEEMESLEAEIKEYENHNRNEYLLNLYDTLKKMIEDDYNSKKHSIMRSKMLSNPKARLTSDNKIEIFEGRSKGTRFTNSLYLVGSSGTIYKKVIGSQVKSVIDTGIDEKIVAIVSDQSDYIEIITKCDGVKRFTAIETSSIKYTKQWINFYDNEYVWDAYGYSEKMVPEYVRKNTVKKISRTTKY